MPGGSCTVAAARCSTCGATATAAFATGAEATIARVGTTVAAARLANCCLTTCGGGSALAERPAMTVFSTATLTLVMLTFRI